MFGCLLYLFIWTIPRGKTTLSNCAYIKFAGLSAHGVVRSRPLPSVRRMQRYTLSNFPARAVGGATWGKRPTLAARAIPEMGQKTNQKLTTIDFGPPGAVQKTTHFRTPSKSTPGGGKVDPCRPWAANGSIFHSFGVHFGSHFTSYFPYFSKPLKTLILHYLTVLLIILGIQKALISGHLFDHFFAPILGPPFGEPFGALWRPGVPSEPRHVDFGPFLGTAWGPKWRLGAPRAA